MRLLMIGPPGSGKGTQAVRIGAHFGVEHISSGDLLRQHVADGTSIGRAVDDCMKRGDLVPDGIVMDMLRRPVEAASRRGGYVLDGFPRTVEQAEAAYLVARELNAAVRIALHLEVSHAELVRRMHARGRQAGRADDTDEVINHRLEVFTERTAPLIDYYARRECLVRVDGDRPVDEVTTAAIAGLEQARREIGM
ncbi:MAG TPA: adenylate kinase [Catenuloplanes sp.]|jgi:adenylate kinase